jgi:hypothetical protein
MTEPGLVFNSLEFGGIKIRIVELFPDAEEKDGILVLEPLLDEGGAALEVTHHVGKGDVVFILPPDDGDLGAPHVDGGVGGFLIHAVNFLSLHSTPLSLRMESLILRE